MKTALYQILANNRSIDKAIEKIEELYADRSDIEKIQEWRQKYYTVKDTNERMSKNLNDKIRVAQDKLVRMQKILMEK